MLEIPEAATIARQAEQTLTGRSVVTAEAGHSPHGFAWYAGGGPAWYAETLTGERFTGARAHAGLVELALGDDWLLTFNDGARLRRLDPGAPRPAKHQLLVELDDDSALVCTVQMYAGILLHRDGDPERDENLYLRAPRTAPSPLTGAFTFDHLLALAEAAKPTLSAKALLATEQRIPGLGNGTLQDILFTAGIHPQRKVRTLDEDDLAQMYAAVVNVLRAMTTGGGRDTEKDLFDHPGGYATILSAKTRDRPCPRCGGPITRKAFLGSNVYLCPTCQPLA
ncbi:MAG: hypothetical protein FWD18_03675 [Micrococcales bacterium]|nr:hypothetical protein [Micrococcales bacterium]